MNSRPFLPIDAAKDALRRKQTEGSDPFECASAMALLDGYESYHPNDRFKVVSVESIQRITIPGTAFSLSGRFDTLLHDEHGRLINLEHKTTNAALDNPFHPQLAKTSFDRQISLYHMISYLNHQHIEETWMDVIRKVSLRPKSIPLGTEKKPFGSKREIEDTATYFGNEVSQETLTQFRAETLKKENPELYGYRVAHAISENPDGYYKRKTRVTRTVDEMRDTLNQLVQVAREIERAEEDESWYQNTNSCFAYGTACAFWTLCSGTDSPSSETWIERKGSSQSGRFSLSHSRIGTFHACRRKYYYTYVLGIEKGGQERSAALRYGSLVHDALEVYWKQFKELQNGNSGSNKD